MKQILAVSHGKMSRAAAHEALATTHFIGCLYAQLGDSEKAFAWLEKSYAMRQADLLSLKVDPALDNIRDDARYAAMMSRVNLAD